MPLDIDTDAMWPQFGHDVRNTHGTAKSDAALDREPRQRWFDETATQATELLLGSKLEGVLFLEEMNEEIGEAELHARDAASGEVLWSQAGADYSTLLASGHVLAVCGTRKLCLVERGYGSRTSDEIELPVSIAGDEDKWRYMPVGGEHLVVAAPHKLGANATAADSVFVTRTSFVAADTLPLEWQIGIQVAGSSDASLYDDISLQGSESVGTAAMQLIVVATKGFVCMLNVNDGSERWCWYAPDGSPLTGRPALDSSMNVYVGHGTELLALNATSGAEMWREDLQSEVIAIPVVYDEGDMVFGFSQTHLYAIHMIDRQATGWHRRMTDLAGERRGGVVLGNGLLIVPDLGECVLRAYPHANPRTQWEYRIGGSTEPTACDMGIIAGEDAVYVRSSIGLECIELVDLDVTPDLPQPDPPVLGQATATSLTIDWAAPSMENELFTFSSYKLSMLTGQCPDSDAPPGASSIVYQGGERSFTLDNLEPEATYCFRVAAVTTESQYTTDFSRGAPFTTLAKDADSVEEEPSFFDPSSHSTGFIALLIVAIIFFICGCAVFMRYLFRRRAPPVFQKLDTPGDTSQTEHQGEIQMNAL